MSEVRIEVEGGPSPFRPGDAFETGDETFRVGDVVWFERLGEGRLVIHKASSSASPPAGVPRYRMERGSAAVSFRLVQLPEPPPEGRRRWWQFWRAKRA